MLDKKQMLAILLFEFKMSCTTPNLWDATKAVLRGKFTAIQSYLKKQEKHRICNLTLHLKQLEKEKQQQQQKQN